MNSNRPSENDKPLRKILSEWRVSAVLPPRFQERVWQRIGSAEKCAPNLRTMIWDRIAITLTRPAFVAAYMTIFLLIGAIAGYQQGQSKTAHVKSNLQARYVQMVDPYQTPR